MKGFRKAIAIILIMIMIFSSFSFVASGYTQNTPKEEVIYVNLNFDGSIKEIYVVNIFDLDEEGKIIDYGSYEELKNMTSSDEIGYSGETVTIYTEADKLYYQGKLNSNVMPWKISIKYFLDDVMMKAEDLAGANGKLSIQVDIDENTECEGAFFDGLALQMEVTLDTDTCKNITAEGATIANVGDDKQITYTIMPGNGADIDISADVSDFEMAGIAINGVKMEMDITIDDSQIQNKIDEISGAVKTMDNGAGSLSEGANELASGSQLLDEKVGDMADGISQLYDGALQLQSGLTVAASNNQQLINGAYSAYEGLCTMASKVVNNELEGTGHAEVNLTPDNYGVVLDGLLAEMNVDSVYNQAYQAALEEVTKQVEANEEELYKQAAIMIITEQMLGKGMSQEQVDVFLASPAGELAVEGVVFAMTDDQKAQIKQAYIDQLMTSEEVTSQINEAVAEANSGAAQIAELKTQLDNYGVFYNGLVEYTNAVSQAATGATELTNGLEILKNGSIELKNAISELSKGALSLLEGANTLKEGTASFVNRLSTVGSEIKGQIQAMIDALTGKNVMVESFVSDKNTNVKSVQFVIKTDGIEIPEVVEAEEIVEKEESFFEKLLALF